MLLAYVAAGITLFRKFLPSEILPGTRQPLHRLRLRKEEFKPFKGLTLLD